MKTGSARPLPAFPPRRCIVYLLAAALLLDQLLGSAYAVVLPTGLMN